MTVRGVRNDGNTIVSSSWVSIPISSWQSDGWPGLVTNLALLSDSGEDFTDGQTENTTIVGSVYIANATSLDGIKVQVDENGDGISDGMTTTDSEGGFVFEPSFVPIGNASVRFRAVRWSDSQSNYRVGPWSSISFLFEDQIDGAARIRNVGKTEAIAANGTNLQSTVSGRITNESSLIGIVVEIDLNDDDAADQVVTTDRFGRFSSTIIGSSNQLDAMRVRTRELDPVSRVTHYGPWVIVSQSYGDGGSNGTGTGGSSSGNGTGNVEGFDGDDLPGGDGVFQADVEAANAAHKAALESAKQSYNQQLANADAAYAIAVELAGSNFQSLLSNFAGNTTSFEFKPLTWPQTPSSGSVFPADSSLPTPPVAKPTYTGPSFDFDEDSIYQAAITANRNAYQAELAAAKTALNSAKSSAEQAHNARVQAINQEYENAAQAAQDTFEDESEVDDSALDALAAAFQAAVDAAWAAYTSAAQALATALNTSLTSAWDTLQSQIQAAHDIYWNAVTAASNAYTNATDHEGCTCDEERSASINYSQSVYEAGKTLDKAVSSARNSYDHTVAGLLKAHAHAMADLWAVYQAAIIEAQDIYDKGKIEFESEAAQQGADAQKNYAAALNDLARIRDRKIADSEKVMALEIATAERTYTLRIEVAETVHWKANAVSKQQAISRWDNAEDTLWTEYQLTLANTEVAYYNQLAIEHMGYTTSVANSEYDRQYGRANAQHEYRYALIDAEHARKLAKLSSAHDLATSNNENATSNAEADAADRKSMREGQNDPAYVKAGADAAYAYAIAVSDANHNYVTSMADARQFIVTSNSCDNRTADRRYPWSWAVVVVSHSSAATIYNTFVKALNQAQYDYGVANVENGNFSSSALSDLWDDYQNAKRDRDTDSANTAATDNRNFQDDHSQADHDYAIAAMRAQSKRTREFSKLDLSYIIDVVPDSTEYDNDKVTLIATRNNWDATSSKDFKSDAATHYATQMNAFHGTYASAWSLYHQHLGAVEVTWATASGTNGT